MQYGSQIILALSSLIETGLSPPQQTPIEPPANSVAAPTMALPAIPAPVKDFIPYWSTADKPPRAVLAPYISFESKLREVFAQDRQNPVLDDPMVNLVPIYAGHEDKVRIRARDLDSEPQAEKDKYLLGLKDEDRRKDGQYAIADSFRQFRDNFNLFSESSLVDLDWSNVVAAGSSVVTALLPIEYPHNQTKRALRAYYHEKLAPASDVDLFLYGLTEEQAVAKIKQIESAVRDSILYETTVVRTKHAITIVSQYPCRHVQIVLRIYKSISEILAGFDVDSACVAYDGKQVYASPRALAAFMTQVNTIDLSRRSPSYENRLSKYSHRGFEVYCHSLDRSRIDPTIFERSFGRVLGLARLLVLEKLPKPADRDEYAERRRRERGRPAMLLNSRWGVALHGNIKEQSPDDVAEWDENDEVSNYHTLTIPYGRRFHAKNIEKLLFAKDLLLNAEWNKPKDRTINLHRHPAFFGSFEDVVGDCCGSCPAPSTEEEKDAFATESETYIQGNITFITDVPGRQQIGSFNPITEDDWTEMAYVGNTARLCQAIIDGDLEHVQDWCEFEGADVNRRDHTGRTPLHLAVTSSTAEIVKCLIDHDARLISRLADGQTALHLAARRGDTEIITLLLERSEKNAAEEAERVLKAKEEIKAKQRIKSDPEEGDDDDESMSWDEDDAAESVEEEEATVDEATGPLVKIKISQTDAEDLGTSDEEPDVYDVNAVAWDSPTSALHIAIMAGHVEAVTMLVERFGADVLLPIKLRDGYSQQPKAAILTLVLAAKYATGDDHETAMIEQLLKLGATSTQGDLKGATPVHWAVHDGNIEALDALFTYDESAARAASRIPLGAGWPQMTILTIGLAIKTKNEALAKHLIELGVPTSASDSDWKAYTSQGRAYANDISYRLPCTRGAILFEAIDNDMPDIAMTILQDVDLNVMHPGTDKLRHSNELDSNQALTILDATRRKIDEFRKKLKDQELSHPAGPLQDREYEASLVKGTYRQWLYASEFKSAQRVHVHIMKDFAAKTDEIESMTRQQIAKQDADAFALQGFEALEQKLEALGAKTFKQLRPDVLIRPADGGYHYEPYRDYRHVDPNLQIRFRVPYEDELQGGYIALFEFAWSGNLDGVKALTMGRWSRETIPVELWDRLEHDENNEDGRFEPLMIATKDQHGFSPYAIAVLRGHFMLAEIMVTIAQAQYNPVKDKPEYRYTIETEEMDWSENDYEFDSGDRFAVVGRLFDDRFTVDNVTALSKAVNSKISPLDMVQWSGPVWRLFGSIQKAETAGVAAPAAQPRIVDTTESSWFIRYSAVHQRICLNKWHEYARSSLLGYAIGSDNTPLFEHLLRVTKALLRAHKPGNEFLPALADWGRTGLDHAMRLGKTDLMSKMMRQTGAGLPIKAMVESTGEEIDEKAKFYQGLTVHGQKRQDWAAANRGENHQPYWVFEPSMLLSSVRQGNLAAIEYFLAGAPLRDYDTFVQAHANEPAIQALAKGKVGIEGALTEWLQRHSALALHVAILFLPTTNEPMRVLELLLQMFPQSLETKSDKGWTPLHLAFRFRQYDAAQYLISHGADLEARDKTGKTILHHLELAGARPEEIKDFLALIKPAVLAKLQLQRTSVKSGAETPFALAIKRVWDCPKEQRELFEVLLESSNGRDLLVLNGIGDYPLHTAVRNGATSLVKLLIQADPSVLYRENAVGMTPFEIADTAMRHARSTRVEEIVQEGWRPIHRRQASRWGTKMFKDEEGKDWSNCMETTLEALTIALAENPGKRELVSVMNANEVAKRVANAADEQPDHSQRDEIDHWVHYGRCPTRTEKPDEDEPDVEDKEAESDPIWSV